MPRLPQPGGDKGTWGNVLNEFLSVEHNPDGSLKATGSLGSRAPLNNPTFTGAVTVPTPSNATDAVTKAYVDALVSAGAPDATTSTKGILQLTGHLTGTATNPQIANTVITNAHISASAAIAKSKLAALNITDTDVAGGANIAQSKVANLTSDLAGKADAIHTHTIGNIANLQSELDGKANDSDVVKLTGDQTVAGEKAFTSTIMGDYGTDGRLLLSGIPGLGGAVGVYGNASQDLAHANTAVSSGGITFGSGSATPDTMISRVGPANLSFNAARLSNLTNPTDSQDAATKAYVDNELDGLLDGAVLVTGNQTVGGEKTFTSNITAYGNTTINQSGAGVGLNVSHQDAPTGGVAAELWGSLEVESGTAFFYPPANTLRGITLQKNYVDVAATGGTYAYSGFESGISYGTDSINARGTTHAITSFIEVAGSNTATSEVTPLLSAIRVKANQRGRFWVQDSGILGPTSGRPDAMFGITMFMNNYYNGSPADAPSHGFAAVSRPGSGPGTISPWTGTATYPNDIGYFVGGYASSSRNAWNYGIQVGGRASGWMGSSETSRIGTGIRVLDYTTAGVVIEGAKTGANSAVPLTIRKNDSTTVNILNVQNAAGSSTIASISNTGLLDATAFSVAGVVGASGTFTTADAKTVTVTNGIITSIV